MAFKEAQFNNHVNSPDIKPKVRMICQVVLDRENLTWSDSHQLITHDVDVDVVVVAVPKRKR